MPEACFVHWQLVLVAAAQLNASRTVGLVWSFLGLVALLFVSLAAIWLNPPPLCLMATLLAVGNVEFASL